MPQIHIGRGTTNLGVFNEEEIRQGLDSGRFFLTDLGWREGMEKWAPLSEFPEFARPSATPLSMSPTVPETPPPIAPGAEERTGLPWDQRQELGLFNAWLATLKLVLFEPARAFSMMHRE